MVAPYTPTEDDFEKLYSGLQPLNINSIIDKIKDNTGIIIFSAIFYVIYNLKSCTCN